VLSRLFRRLFLERLTAAYQAGRLEFFADQAALVEPPAFKAHLAAQQKVEWVVYAKRPFGGPDAVLAYLSRYTHRIAIANSRLVAFDGTRVTFKWKDYRAKADARYKLMTLDANEFIRRFLIHVLPDGFHRIRHYGLFANANRAANIALARWLLGAPDPRRISSLEAFRTPAPVHPHTPVTGGRPKTLNDSGRSQGPRNGPKRRSPRSTTSRRPALRRAVPTSTARVWCGCRSAAAISAASTDASARAR
jgi:hypothetical protein